jgi:hypothetical protein
MVEQDDAEAAVGIGDLEGEAAISVARVAAFAICLIGVGG